MFVYYIYFSDFCINKNNFFVALKNYLNPLCLWHCTEFMYKLTSLLYLRGTICDSLAKRLFISGGLSIAINTNLSIQARTRCYVPIPLSDVS